MQPDPTGQTESPLTWPKKADQPRISQYQHYDDLYSGDHYKAFAIVADKGFTDKYSKLRYIAANFAGLMSQVMADTMFGDNIKFEVTDKTTQQFLDGLIEDNHLKAQLYESELNNSRRGDAIFKLRIGPTSDLPNAESTVIIEEVTPAIYFPTLDASQARNVPIADILVWTFVNGGKTYLHKEIHKPGYIFTEIYGYDPVKMLITSTESPEAFGFDSTQETRVDESLVFHIPNKRDGAYFGTSDYRDLEQLFFALNNRITKIDNILDKHSDPILAVPPGVIDEKGQVKKSALNMFVVDNENPGFNKPEYIVWNANLEWAFKEIDKIIDMLYMFSGIAPATTGYEADQNGGGQAASGRALKFKLLSTLRKRNQKIIYYDIAIREMLETALELAQAWGISIDNVRVTNPEKPTIDWGDGVLNDIVEMTDIEIKRVEGGLSSRTDSIAKLDNISQDEARKKVKEIDKEAAILVPNLDKVVTVKNPVDKNPLVTGSPDVNPDAKIQSVAPIAGK